jgi:hypothetical protein
MKKLVFAICAAMTLAGATSIHAQEFKYIFVPSSTDLGSLNQWGGALFLDAPMSVGGSISDIDESDSFLKTPFGTFDLTGTGAAIKGAVPFTWSASIITSMNIAGSVDLATDDQWQITQTSVGITLPDPQTPEATGVWVASVPDSGSTAVLIGLAACGLCGFNYFSRSRKVATA